MSDIPQSDRWSGVIRVVREFETYLATDAPKLEIVNANDSERSYEEYRRRKREYRICSGNGVSLIFHAEEQLRYVGSTVNEFDDRIWDKKHDVCRKWTDVIAFGDDWCFMPPALECFLIAKLQPSDNKNYRGLTVGQRAVIRGDGG